MESSKELTALSALLVGARLAGCSNSNEVVQTDPNAEEMTVPFIINPEKNADGNYNILFVMTDQEHYFSEYPAEAEYQARELLQQLGTTFEKHYACSNMSTSSRSVIYTGMHITDTEMIDNTDFPWQDALSEDKVTIGDRLREAGLYTAYKGKWHMGNSSILYAAEKPLTDLEAYGFADWDTDKDYIGEVQEGHRVDPIIVADSVEWIRSTGKELNKNGQSFFLAVNLVNPHDIMNYTTEDGFTSTMLKLAGAPDARVYEKTYDEPLPSTWKRNVQEDGSVLAIGNYQNKWYSQTGWIDEDSFTALRDYYFNCIQDSDNNLKDLLTELDNMHMLDNTIIVITSDHGEMQGAHGLKGKGGFVYDYNLHVPLIIYHPDYEGGRRIDAVTSHVDLAPTFIDMTFISDEKKAEISQGLCGRSLMDLMNGTAESIREGALFCYEMLSFAASQTQDADGNTVSSIDNRAFVRAIITEDFKFARYFSPLNFNTPETLEELLANNDIELYDLKNDPDEINNLALDPEANADLIMEMNAKLNALIEKEIGEDNGAEIMSALFLMKQAQQQGSANE